MFKARRTGRGEPPDAGPDARQPRPPRLEARPRRPDTRLAEDPPRPIGPKAPGSSTRFRRSRPAAWLNSATGPSACVQARPCRNAGTFRCPTPDRRTDDSRRRPGSPTRARTPSSAARCTGARLPLSVDFRDRGYATTVEDLAGLLHVAVHHVAGPSSSDRLQLTVGCAVGAEELPSVQTEDGQVAGDRTARDQNRIEGELVGDASGRPLVGTPHLLNECDHLDRCRTRLMMRCRASINQPEFAASPVPVHPLRGRCSGNPHLRGYMRDRASLAPLDQPAAPLRTMVRSRGSWCGRGCTGRVVPCAGDDE